MIAIEQARRAGQLGRAHWTKEALAGIVVGVVALPLAMAFAVASGAKPEQGIYTAIIAGIAVALFGGSRVQVAGPTGAFAVMLAHVMAQYGYSGLQIATLLAGVMLVLFGVFKLGTVVKLIPEAVVLGFTAGIGIVIWVGQWPAFFGLKKPEGEVLEVAGKLIASLGHLDPTTTLIGVLCVIVIAVWPRIPKVGVVPGPLVALVGATVFVAVARPASVETIGTMFGGVPRGLPSLTLPHLDLAVVVELIRPAFSIALLGAIESLLSATVADGMTGTKHDADQELIGQGIANMASPLFGGIAATGAIARTATSVRHGGRSPLAAIIHAGVLILVLLVLAPLASYVPMAALAGILFVVAFNMSDAARVFRTVNHAPRTDVAIMLITLVLTVAFDIVVAVEVGVAIALVVFLRKMSAAVEVRSVGEGAEATVDAPEGVLVYAIEGPFFFGAIEQFEHALATTHTEPQTVVIDLARVPFVDMTGLIALRDAIDGFHLHHIEVVLCGANEIVAAKLGRAEISQKLDVPVSSTLDDVIETLRTAERPARSRK